MPASGQTPALTAPWLWEFFLLFSWHRPFAFVIQGIFLARLEQKNRQSGYLDLFELDNPDLTDDSIRHTGLFDRLGHVTVVGQAENADLYLGYADETGYDLLNYRLLEGRMPEAPGEIALEQSALLALDEALALGDTVSMTVVPVDGTGEGRSFTLVGILREKTEYLQMTYGSILFSDNPVMAFPSILLSSQEPAFHTGRLAVHRVMSLKRGVSLRSATDACYQSSAFSHTFFITPTGLVLHGFDSGMDYLALGSEVTALLFSVVFLALSLLTGCCVGIAGSMETVLSKRTEEIGILRAVGATRRQIRRMYGRESFLLAALVAPAAILCGCLCVLALQWALPEQILFRPTVWLLLPVGILSGIVILLAGWIPLNQASRKMPMSVLRDTELLRKAGKLKSSSTYLPARHLALRRLRLYPGQQAGVTVLVMLMFIGAGCLGAIASNPTVSYSAGKTAFTLGSYHRTTIGNFYASLPGHAITWQDTAQIAALPKVTGVEVLCAHNVTLLTQGDSSYFEFMNSKLTADEAYYRQVQESLDTDMDLLPYVTLAAYDLGQDSSLSENITEGRIDLDALNSGREVIVIAPTWWGRMEEDGVSYLRYPGREKKRQGDKLLCSNDYFHAGQTLAFVQQYITANPGSFDPSLVENRKRTVTVGAIADGYSENNSWASDSFTIVTTLEGLKSLDLYTDGIREVNVSLASGVDREMEDALAQRIEGIARRSSDTTFVNRIAFARERAAQQRGLLLLFAGVTLIFFTAAVGMIQSTVIRQLQKDGRTIGMLRAVGADEKTILRCYSLPAYLSIFLGLLLAMGLLSLVLDLGSAKRQIPPALAIIAFCSGVCALACRGLLARRVREITSQSIIDTIREL